MMSRFGSDQGHRLPDDHSQFGGPNNTPGRSQMPAKFLRDPNSHAMTTGTQPMEELTEEVTGGAFERVPNESPAKPGRGGY